MNQEQITPAFQHLLRHAWHQSPFYHDLYRAHGIREKDLDHLSVDDIPFVTKERVMSAFDEVVTDRRLKKAAILKWLEHDFDPHNHYLDQYIIIHSSGGSTTQGIMIYDSASWGFMTALASSTLHTYGQGRPAGRMRNAFYYGKMGHFGSVTNAALASPALIEPLIISLYDPVGEVVAQLNAFQP